MLPLVATMVMLMLEMVEVIAVVVMKGLTVALTGIMTDMETPPVR